ncbi:uncharacterized protein RCO7_10340 [Rhynchosporium graminicola]|uniref:Uncharacterized protein n=1 Tax=Rhynchosporium graminicola TaxID=2792576 RepID=A0A1E1K853_9HELO|nr:uncharacterized protein RCO7_10340 [Rhynchosporium commune]
MTNPDTATRQRRHDFEAYPEDKVEAHGCNHDPSNYGDDADDTFPSIKKLLDPLLRKEIAAIECQGTRAWPMILEDDGGTPDHTADSEVNPTSNAGPVPVFKLGQRAESFNREPWWDVEGDCFVYEDLHPLPSLDHEDLVFTPAQEQPIPRCDSLEVSQGQTKPYGDDRTTRSASEESAARSLIITLDEDGGKESEEKFSDLERDMQLAFEEQEELSSTSPSSPGRRSFEPSRPPTDAICERSWSAKLQSSTRLRSQKDMDGPREQE